MTIILFVLLLTFLIVIHELGHLFVAKWSKVHIEEFGIGLPPKICTVFTWQGIPITLNWIFMGGFVRMEGEDGTATDDGKVKKENDKRKTYPFFARPLHQKLAVVIAGPFVNFAFGVIVFATLFSIYGVPERVNTPPTLQDIIANSPASQSGLRIGDMITGVQVVGDQAVTPVSSNQAFIDFINANRGKDLLFRYKRGDEQKTVTLHARSAQETPQGQGATGIVLASQVVIKQYPWWQRPFRGIVAGLSQSVEFGITILGSLGSIVHTIASGAVPKDVSGPVGIASQAQKEKIFDNGIVTTLNFAALLSINLAVMNLLPIPALDGGRAVLLIIEKFVRGKKFAQISYWLNTAGFIFLISLLLLITLKDIGSIVFAK